MANIDKLIAFEEGELSDQETLELFAELIKSGECWSLQGFYGRTAEHFIQQKFIDRRGNITLNLSDLER